MQVVIPILPTKKTRQGKDNRQHFSSKGAQQHPKPGRDGSAPFPADYTAWKRKQRDCIPGGGEGTEAPTSSITETESMREERRVTFSHHLANPAAWDVNHCRASQRCHIGQVWVSFGLVKGSSAHPEASGGCVKLDSQAAGRGDMG